MINKLSRFIYKQSRLVNIVVIFAIFLMLLFIIFPYFKTKIGDDKQILDLLFAFSPDTAYEVLNSYNDYEKTIYTQMILIADYLYPIVYSIFLSFGISINLRKILTPKSRLLKLNILPIIPLISDFLENSSILPMLHLLPHRINALAYLASTANTIKWISLSVCMLMIVFILFVRIFRIIKKRYGISEV